MTSEIAEKWVRAGLSQKQLAELARVSQPNLSAYESGKRIPRPETLDRIMNALRRGPSEILSLDEQALADLTQAYDDAAAAASRGEVRALLLRGEGRAFCAGRDISGVTPETDDAEAYLAGWCGRC